MNAASIIILLAVLGLMVLAWRVSHKKDSSCGGRCDRCGGHCSCGK